MTRVLIVEDSRSFSALLAKRIRADLGFEPVAVATLADARELLGRDKDFLAALVDINLPDAPHGEAVDVAVRSGVPVIVFTGELSDSLRESFWNRHIVDYVLKDARENLDYVVRLLGRLNTNPGTKILVVDDSRSFCRAVSRLLSTHRYTPLEALNGHDALAVLEANPDVRLVMVDYNMPDMDGFALTREIRRRFGKDVMAVLGISVESSARLSARFIKSGANDFLCKPFLAEEFYTRVTQNLEMLEHIAQIRDMAERDYLTRVYNRRYFFSAGTQMHALLARRDQPVCVAMLDLDHFKAVNDTYGHEAGDTVLCHVAQVLESRFRLTDIVARIGGEEFCVLAADMPPEKASQVFEELRSSLERTPVQCGDTQVSLTVSIGLCCQKGLSLEAMLREADRMLYQSKSEGRNRVTRDVRPA